MSDLFLSYSRKDKEKAQKLVWALDSQGWTVWWDRTIPAGKTFDTVIEEQLDAARCVVVLWSRHSTESRWVRTEAAEGLQRDILVPVLIDNAKLPLAFRRVQTLNLAGWDGNSNSAQYRALVANITAVLNTDQSRESAKSSVSPPISKAIETPDPGRSKTGSGKNRVRNASLKAGSFSWRRLTIYLASFMTLLVTVIVLWYLNSATNTPPDSPILKSPNLSSGYILVDDFKRPAYGLGELFDHRNLKMKYTDEGVKLVAVSKGILPALYSSSIKAKNFRATFTFRDPDPMTEGTYGLIFRSDDYVDRALSHYLLLGFDLARSAVNLSTFKNNKWESKESKVVRGFHELKANHVRADVLGNTVRVFLNDREVAYFENIQINEAGLLGLYISAANDSNEEVVFTHLDIYPEF